MYTYFVCSDTTTTEEPLATTEEESSGLEEAITTTVEEAIATTVEEAITTTVEEAIATTVEAEELTATAHQVDGTSAPAGKVLVSYINCELGCCDVHSVTYKSVTYTHQTRK